MKHIYILFAILLTYSVGHSQMAAAKEIPPNVSHRIKIKAPVNAVWEYLLKFENLSEFGSEIVSKSTTKGIGLGSLRDVVFKDGTQRSEEVEVIAPRFKKIGFKVLTSDKIFSRYFYVFEINRANDFECFVTLKSYYGLNSEKESNQVKRKVKKELETLLKGLKLYFEN
ncbi:SRPBCC family protein [Flavivirga spongiicola]|uniref:SRPBCC family protein n=1 Tax=Flavivirga spongiicola TaxID=421621 RepID=A0ABU7XPV7_9FLAO|nr:SRPBCC family protein [Flavivirga sp. MEBiC05379]MDO5977827.1 SRPBCC family protein [Flavivirga sp. MEBiC05379]